MDGLKNVSFRERICICAENVSNGFRMVSLLFTTSFLRTAMVQSLNLLHEITNERHLP